MYMNTAFLSKEEEKRNSPSRKTVGDKQAPLFLGQNSLVSGAVTEQQLPRQVIDAQNSDWIRNGCPPLSNIRHHLAAQSFG